MGSSSEEQTQTTVQQSQTNTQQSQTTTQQSQTTTLQSHTTPQQTNQQQQNMSYQTKTVERTDEEETVPEVTMEHTAPVIIHHDSAASSQHDYQVNI